MSRGLTPGQEKLVYAVTAIFDAADPDQKGTHRGFATLLVRGPGGTFHAMALAKYMEAENPLHDLAHALWRRRAAFNPYWDGRSATVG